MALHEFLTKWLGIGETLDHAFRARQHGVRRPLGRRECAGSKYMGAGLAAAIIPLVATRACPPSAKVHFYEKLLCSFRDPALLSSLAARPDAVHGSASAARASARRTGNACPRRA